MKRILVAAIFAACTFTAFALPSVDAVRAEVAQGDYPRAEQMIREVLAARPDSARARYVHAEILAHEGRFAQAAAEAAQARQLDPALTFTRPEAFRAFESLLSREQSAPAGTGGLAATVRPTAAGAPGGVPGWVWGAGLGLLALLVLSRFAWPGRQASAPAAAPLAPVSAASVGAASPPAGLGYPATTGVSGGGLMGTGLAVAGGMAAGMLAERLLEGHRDPVPGPLWSSATAPAQYEAFDDNPGTAALELEERPVDMGIGDGWGGTAEDSGPSGGGDDW